MTNSNQPEDLSAIIDPTTPAPAPKGKGRKATAPKAEVTAVAEPRAFKTPAMVAEAFSALSGLLTEDQRSTLRAQRANVGGKMAAAFLLGIAPKAKA